MRFHNARKVARPSRTLLGVEILDGRVLPSAGVSLPTPMPLDAAEVRISDFTDGHQVDCFGGASGAVLRGGNSNIPALQSARHVGEETPQLQHIGEEIPQLRTIGEEVQN